MKKGIKKTAKRSPMPDQNKAKSPQAAENERDNTPESKTPSTFLSAKDLADITGVSIQYIGRMRKDGLLIATDGRYDMADTVNLQFVEKYSQDTEDEEERESENKKNIRLKNIKLQLDIDIKLKKFIAFSFVETVLFRYVERLHSDIERRASVILDDFFPRIIADSEKEGHLMNDTRCKFQDEYLCLVDDCKKAFMRELKQYSPEDYPG